MTDKRLGAYGGTTILEGQISEGIVRGHVNVREVRRWREAVRAGDLEDTCKKVGGGFPFVLEFEFCVG